MENRIFDSVPTTQGLPIVGDRYSFILSDVPVSNFVYYIQWNLVSSKGPEFFYTN